MLVVSPKLSQEVIEVFHNIQDQVLHFFHDGQVLTVQGGVLQNE
jgi:hypothetical protein